MSRRRITNQRKICPDSKFGSETLAKFINIIMKNGKKSIAEKIVYTALNMLSEFSKKGALESFEDCLKKVKPVVEVRSRRVGGSTYQVPVEIRPIRQNTLAMRWIIESARRRKEKSMGFRIAHEFFDIMENKGFSIKKREDMHRTADANKAFAHYKW